MFGITLPQDSFEEESKDFVVWEENWDSVLMFMRMQTQWQVAGMGGYTGLRYDVLEWLCRLYHVKDERQLLEDIQVMERAALSELNKSDG